jgi:diguanylate cyclase (GGDEF)-like protein/PAS domain S-box-containing protein
MIDVLDDNAYRLVLESLPIGLFVVNREGKIILWNAGAERLTGYLRQEAIGRPCAGEFLAHTNSEENALTGAAHPLVETMRDGKALSVPASICTKAGHYLSVNLRTVPRRNDRGGIAGAAEIFEEIAAKDPANRRQSKLAAFGCLDQLTGLLNHSMIQAHLKENVSLYAVYPVPFCVMCFAIDDLAQLRKRFGQAAVDASLRVVGQTLESGLRPTDFVGRWLEEEFLAVLIECNEADVMNVGQRLRKMVQHTGITFWGDFLRVTVSLGATTAHDHDTPGSMISRAEQALRESVKAGGNRVVVISH